MRPNNSFKPKPLRYTKGMAGKACHAFGSTTQFGLTQALGAMNKIPGNVWKIGIASLWGVALVSAFVTTTPRPWALTIVGIGLGCLVGHIRSRAIGAGNSPRVANALAWLSGIGLLVLAMAIAEDMFIGAWAASFAGCLLFDSVYSLPASYGKEQVSSGAAADGT